MAESEHSPLQSASASGVDEVRQQLMRRIAIAGVTILSLVAALAVFDSALVSDAPAPVTEVAVAPVETGTTAAPSADPDPLPIKPEETPPATITEAAEDPVPPPVAPPPPERTASPEAPPLRTAPRPLTKPATAQPASIKPSTVPESTKAATSPAARPPAARPLAQVAESQRRYVVQMGVFNNVANAEELFAKLQKAGIPAQIEARVHVGPFANRTEAEAAQKKLNELGLDGGMLITSRK